MEEFWITPDLATKQSQLQIEEHSAASKRCISLLLAYRAEDFGRQLFNDRAEVEQFWNKDFFD